MEKKLRMEKERCAVLERSHNRKVVELFTREQKGKTCLPTINIGCDQWCSQKDTIKTGRTILTGTKGSNTRNID